MKNRWRASARSNLIVEIGARHLNVAEVGHVHGRARIERLRVEEHGDDTKAAPLVLSSCLKDMNVTAPTVVSYMPRHSINMRALELPSTETEEVHDMLDLQIGKLTPYSKDEIVSDYRTVGGGHDGYTRVLVAIVQRTVLRQRYHVLEQADADVEAMSVSTEGVLNWYLASEAVTRAEADQADVVLDIDATHTDLLVVADGQLVFTRSIMIGAEELSNPSADRRFSEEVRQALEVFRGEMDRIAIRYAYLSGAAARIQGLPTRAKAMLDVPVAIVDPMEDIDIADAVTVHLDPAWRHVSFTPLIGAALAPGDLRFQLVPEAIRVRRRLEVKAKNLTSIGVSSMAALVCMVLVALVHSSFKVERLKHLRADVERTEAPAREVEGWKQKILEVKERLDSRFSPVAAIRDVAAAVPQEIYLKKFELARRNRVILNGSAQNRGDIRDFRFQLEESKLFKNVETLETRRGTGGKLDFEMICPYDIDPEGG